MFFETVGKFFVTNPTIVPISIGALIAIFGIAKQRQSSREKNSIDFESSYKQSKDIEEAWMVLKIVVQNRLDTPIDHWAGGKAYGSEEAIAIRRIINEWERAANGINHKIYDDDFLYKTYGTTVIELYTFLRPYITATQNYNPRVFAQFTRLAIRWIIRRTKEDRKEVDTRLLKAYEELNDCF